MRRKLFTVVSLLLCAVVVSMWVSSWPRPKDAVFRHWRSITHEDARREIAEEIVRDRHLIGLAPDDVVRELGRPNGREMGQEYGHLKYIVGDAFIDDLWLCIHVEGGRVQKTDIRSD